MTMLRRIGVWLVVALLATATAAQGGPATTAAPTHRPGPFAQILRLAQHLDLTGDQKTQLHALLQSAQQQVKAIRQDTALTDPQKREKVRQVIKQTRMDFTALLTPEQHARLVHFARVPGPLAALARLNLTDTQKAQVKTIFLKLREDVRTVRQNTTLAPEQRQQEIKQIRETSHKQFLALLTPEQLQLWERMHPHGGMPNSGGTGQ